MAYPPNPGSGGGGSSNVHIGPLPPDKPNLKPMWLNTTDETLYHYIIDPVSELPSWRQVNPDEELDLTGYLQDPVSESYNINDVIFYSGDGRTFTNGIKTNQYNQLDVNFNRIKNAVIDCGAFYD